MSFVTPSRNDDHGGNALGRMLASLNGRLEQLERYRIESELILIDWNPPDDKPLLKDILDLPDKHPYCTIRVIVVPPATHQRYAHWEKRTMNVIAATNCGVRRARGQFILPSPIDLLYPEEFMMFVASRKLKKDERYRTNRCDVDRNVLRYQALKEQLDFCKNNIILNKDFKPAAKGRFWMLRKDLPNLHTSACGDFQLMSRDYWHLLRGYREADIIGAHVDNLLSYGSYAVGVREVVLEDPICVYHIDHDGKFNDVKETTKLPLEDLLTAALGQAWLGRRVMGLYRRMLALLNYTVQASCHGIPTLDYEESLEMCREIVAGKRSYVFNDENWGLGQESFKEYRISTAAWETERSQGDHA